VNTWTGENYNNANIVRAYTPKWKIQEVVVSDVIYINITGSDVIEVAALRYQVQ